MKTFKSTVLLVAVAGVLSAAAQAQPQSPTNASWGAYRSIVNPSVAVDDSFNRTTNNSVDASRSATGSFNRSTDVDTRISTDNSRRTDDSFNRTYDNDTSVDASRRTVGSFNTSLDLQAVTPTVNSTKSIATLDTQSASNTGYMGGATQVGTQGDFNLTMGGGQPAYAHGGKYRSPASTTQSYDIDQANAVRLGGDNNGLIRNQNYLNIGGAQVVDSDLGNKQSFYAGPQTQIQGVNQDKHSATQTSASDTVSTTVSK